MRLRAHIPPTLEAERRHALSLVLGDILGLEMDVIVDANATGTTITDGEARLQVTDDFFTAARASWLTAATLPREPLRRCHPAALPPGSRLVADDLPVLFGDAGNPWQPGEREATLRIDVFGTAFFLMTRYEEVVVGARDQHGRFPREASHLSRADLLLRPLADEHGEVLWAALATLWPQLSRPRRSFGVFSTHDVDHPFQLLNSGAAGVLREAASRLRRRHDVLGTARTPLEWRRVRRRGVAHDPSNNFAEIMDADEAAGARSAFYFIADPDPTGRIRRQRYRLDDPAIGALLRAVHGRGHEVGVHPSYKAHLQPTRLRDEVAALQRRCAALQIDQPAWGGRSHYLRWDSRRSPRVWADAGLAYDSSLAYAEMAGFRTGSCHPFHLWDFEARATLPVLERPLLAMDISLTAAKYESLDSARALDRLRALKRACRRVDGEFVVLWHNDVLTDPTQWELYREAIAAH